MAKKKKLREERLTYKKLLSKEEYKEYKQLRKAKEQKKAFRKLEELRGGERKQKERTALTEAFGAEKIVGILKGKPQAIKSERRTVARRAAGVRRLFSAVEPTTRGRGRPSGTYKYGVPIQQYKRLRSQRRALYEVYKQRQMMELGRRGLTPEQIRQLQFTRTVQEGGQVVQVPQQQFDKIDTPESVMAPVDDDLQFRRFRAEKTISPNTQSILRRLRHTQLKSQRDDVEMQRRLNERKMVAQAGNLMATPFIFNRFQMDVTKLADGDKEILKAPNVFKEREDNMNIMKTKRFNILQTGEAGNNLNFF